MIHCLIFVIITNGFHSMFVKQFNFYYEDNNTPNDIRCKLITQDQMNKLHFQFSSSKIEGKYKEEFIF